MELATQMISVVICTWNRSTLLRKTLEHMTLLETPPGTRWELIVVNNNCSDDTDLVINEFATRLPLVRLFEPSPGKSHAANLAVQNATGAYIIWTDDDVLVDTDWLTAYLQAFSQWPDASVFAGGIDPWFEKEPPRWLERAFSKIAAAYAALDYGPDGFEMSQQTPPFGANMALKRSAHLSEAFDGRLGPRPNSGIRGEETSLVRRLISAGHTGRWIPEARVRHFIPAERMSLAYLKQYFIGAGEVSGLTDPHVGRAALFGRPLWLWKEVCVSQARYVLTRLFRSPGIWIVEFRRANVAWGQLRTYVSATEAAPVRTAGAAMGAR
jgi:GT2 family glycosyltransferase